MALNSLRFSIIKRNAALRGPTQSHAWNDSFDEVVRDFAVLAAEWNRTLVPLFANLPDGTNDLDAYVNGLDGQTLYTKADATVADTDYYNTDLSRPVTVYEQFVDLYAQLADVNSVLQGEIDDLAFTAASTSIIDVGGYYTSTFVEGALQELGNTLDNLNFDDLYFRETEHINVSTGAADEGKPIVLDEFGKVDGTMLPAAIEYSDTSNISGNHGLTPWFIPCLGNTSGITTGNFNANWIVAVPFIAPRRGGTVGVLGVQWTSSTATSVLRYGIYANSGEGDVYPGALVFGSDEIDTSTAGTDSATPDAELVPGEIYWVVVSPGVTTITLTVISNGASQTLLGSSSLGTAVISMLGKTSGYTYGALPSTFPTGASYQTISAPVVGIQFSA